MHEARLGAMVRMVLWRMLALSLAWALSGCGSRTFLNGQATAGSGGATSATATNTTSSVGIGSVSSTGGIVPPQRPLDKLDILLAIDNSISMADKQQLLVAALPDLIGRLANPYCVDSHRHPYRELTPPVGEDCPPGPNGEELVREFLPVLDVHVGVVTSSLVEIGAHPCTIRTRAEAAGDLGHLFGSLPRASGVSGLNEWGFLEWGPETEQAVFEQQVEQMVAAVQENGCGWESTLEAWFRFLVDPAPHEQVVVTPCSEGSTDECLEKAGVDEVILEQRRAFLRPDSVVLVIVLSDENDCSAVVDSRSWQLFSTSNQRMARGTSVCDTDPNDECCYSCEAERPVGCEADPRCSEPVTDPYWDQSNLRCFEQKRRFGVDVLQPLRRYVAALSQAEICPNETDLGIERGCDDPVPNPLFSDLDTGEPIARKPGAAFLTTIVGVPWQDLAAETDIAGDPIVDNTLRYKSPDELESDGTWDLLIGSTSDPPGDPLMLESILPRTGTQPITGEAVAQPDAGPFANSVNGHERDIPDGSDLQYSCIFPFPMPRDCAKRDPPCDCTNAFQGNSPNTPLCQDPGTGLYSTIQHSGKAYPPQRHVRLVRSLGQQGVLSSICARNTGDATLPDFAYRPAVAALVERIAPVLRQPE